MIIGIETSVSGIKTTGTNWYLSCLLEQLDGTSNKIIAFAPKKNIPFSSVIPSSVTKHLYRNFRLGKELTASHADCAIFPDYYMPDNYTKPSAIVIHDLSFITHPWFYSRKFTSFYTYKLKQTLKNKPVIIAVSEHTKRNIIRYLDIRSDNIIVVQGYSKLHYAVSGEFEKHTSGRPYFLYVGHIESRKNLKFMIEGFLEWKRYSPINYKLKIVGELWIKSKETAEILHKYLHHPDIEFTGYISNEYLEDMYKNASAFIHTSIEEGFGFPVLEAMEYKLPLLCSADTATEEISKPGSIVINPYDKLSYISGLEELNNLVTKQHTINYIIKYSRQLMSSQLNALLSELEYRVKNSRRSVIFVAKSNSESMEKTPVYSEMFNTGIKALQRNNS